MAETLMERMKSYEAQTRMLLPANSFYVLRVDGKNFSTYTKGLDAPFDAKFASDMDELTRTLTQDISGALLGYTQSDEISVIFTDRHSEGTQAHFGGSVLKIVSLSAALASSVFNELRPGNRALFDARVFALPSAVEVHNYLLWRQRDAIRNSVSMAARAHFSHKEMVGVNTTTAKEMLRTAGHPWEELPQGFRQGRSTLKVARPGSVELKDPRTGGVRTAHFERSVWETAASLLFDGEGAKEIAGLLEPFK